MVSEETELGLGWGSTVQMAVYISWKENQGSVLLAAGTRSGLEYGALTSLTPQSSQVPQPGGKKEPLISD